MKQKNKLAGLQKRKSISGYLFISPFIIGFLVFMIRPFFNSLYMSFCEVTLSAGVIDKKWTGLANYYFSLRTDPNFTTNLLSELGRMVVYSLAIMVFSLFIALILNMEFKGRALVRAVFFLPVILSSGVILGLESNNKLMDEVAQQVELAASGVSVTDAVESILRTMNIGTKIFDKVFEVIDNIYDVALASGIQIIIYLSGLQTISSSMYEAASIEGCTKWESFWKITFPMISSLFLVNWIYTVVDFCMRSDNAVITQIQNFMITQLKYGYASAMSWIYFLIVMAFIGLSALIISKGVYYYE